jgi:structural maintenance of chromosome 2
LTTFSPQEADALAARLSRLQFQYADPEKGFDRSKVKGLVANLFQVEDGSTVTALEVTAGGKLWNVVVDSAETGNKLLKHGKLKNRVTLIPLNKITRRDVKRETVDAAKSLVGKENVDLAKDLIKYSAEMEPAMAFVFGNTLVCRDLETAKTVTFDRKIKTKSVTLQGDSFDPAGTLTGGSAPKSGSVLKEILSLTEARAKADELHAKLEEVSTELARLIPQSENFKALSSELQISEHEFELVTQRLQQSAQHKFIESVKKMETELEEAAKAIPVLQENEAAAREKVLRLEKESKSFADHRDEKIKLIKINLAETKKSHQTTTKTFKQAQQTVAKLAMEIEEAKKEIASLEEQLKTTGQTLGELEISLQKLAEEIKACKTQHDQRKADLDSRRHRLQEQSSAIQKLVKEREASSAKIAENDLKIKKIEHKIARQTKEREDAEKFVQNLEVKYSWIEAEKAFFGREGDYNFQASDPAKAQAELEKLQHNQERLSRSINRKVIAMWEKAEQEYQELREKRDTIEGDKDKIEKAIRELDQKKAEALQATWEKVNGDFGSIFRTLLPGVDAKLEPPAGGTVMDGLEFCVSFSGVWTNKDQLSGGQKSLLALSLILALLRFKPAPMYILDEIDAALDLNHTQNIGVMLRTHFKESQFIVVSLKEGMFKNANVLFKVKGENGTSVVTRIKAKE